MNLKPIDDLYPSMPWDEIDNVVFDVGNVLLTFIPHKIVSAILPDKPELHERLLQVIFRSPFWLYQDMGLTTIPEAAQLMCESAPELKDEITQIMQGWAYQMQPVDEGLRALEACRAHGKKLYVLSNFGDDAFAIEEERFSFFESFDGKIISGRVHTVKPLPEIYRLLTGTYSLEPSRTLFIDDSNHNTAGAITCGLHGLCFNAPGKLDRFFI